MITTITKTFNYQIKRDHYTIFGHPSFKNTNVFHEYYDLIMKCPNVNKLGLVEMIKTFKPISKSRIRITYDENRIEFFKPNKYIFPEFYIEFHEVDLLNTPIVGFDKPFPEGYNIGFIVDEVGHFDPRNYISGMDSYKENSNGKGSLWRIKKKN